jgi:hypothetical protein
MFVDGEFQPHGQDSRPWHHDTLMRACAGVALSVVLAVALSLLSGRPAVEPLAQLVPHAAKRHPAPVLNSKSERCLRQFRRC